MSRKIPQIEELIKVNRIVNRRLYVEEGRRDKHFLVDAKGEKVNAKLISEPRLVDVAWDINPYHDLDDGDKRKFHLSCGWVFNFNAVLNREETKIALGLDYSPGYSNGELRAVIEAATGGPGLANSYVLGGRVWGPYYGEEGYVAIPVQYYKIKPKRHKELGIESDPRKLEGLIAQIKRDGKEPNKRDP